MTKREKLLAKLERNPRGVALRDFEALIRFRNLAELPNGCLEIVRFDWVIKFPWPAENFLHRGFLAVRMSTTMKYKVTHQI